MTQQLLVRKTCPTASYHRNALFQLTRDPGFERLSTRLTVSRTRRLALHCSNFNTTKVVTDVEASAAIRIGWVRTLLDDGIFHQCQFVGLYQCLGT